MTENHQGAVKVLTKNEIYQEVQRRGEPWKPANVDKRVRTTALLFLGISYLESFFAGDAAILFGFKALAIYLGLEVAGYLHFRHQRHKFEQQYHQAPRSF